LLLGERVANVLIFLLALFLILHIVGFDTGTALAGLGIVGVALAVGAQKTVENFLGGVFLLSDKALSVGDLCSISNRLGFVEDVTLRSIRLRTLEQTLLSIPAGVLSQESIENFSSRGKILAQTMLRLRYGTSAEQLDSILDGVRRLVAEHPKIETGTSRVRLVDFGVQAIEVELFAYVLTSDFGEFLATREELLLQIARLVEASGASFARPEVLATVRESPPAEEARLSIGKESFHRSPDVLGNSSK
jgi:MscS family membrane protein